MSEIVLVLSIAPVIDAFIHPGFEGVSVITQKFINVLLQFEITPSKIVFLSVFLGFAVFQSVLAVIFLCVMEKTIYGIIKDLTINAYNTIFNAQWQFFVNEKHHKNNIFVRTWKISIFR